MTLLMECMSTRTRAVMIRDIMITATGMDAAISIIMRPPTSVRDSGPARS